MNDQLRAVASIETDLARARWMDHDNRNRHDNELLYQAFLAWSELLAALGDTDEG